jgi:outer membrane protein assembly factor BamB
MPRIMLSQNQQESKEARSTFVPSTRRIIMKVVQKRLSLLLAGFFIMLFAASCSTATQTVQSTSSKVPVDRFNAPGNVLISDQFNNRVVEVAPDGHVVWTFGSGNPTLCNPGPGAIIGLNDAERLSGGLTLTVGTGIPAGSQSFPKGCADNRVIVVDHQGKIVWQYGQAGVSGSGPNQLNTPVFAIQLPSRNIMVVDQANNRVIEIDRTSKQIVWSYGPKSGPGALNNPNSAELLPNGHILIGDENNNRVIEITRDGTIVWQYSQGLSAAAYASRLPNGDTLITDSSHSRVLEVNPNKKVVFEYFTNTDPSSNSAPLPTNAVQLANGGIIIADQFNHRVLMVNPKVYFQYGMVNVAGNQPGQLNGPYTSFVIGDYTGQTPPPATF